MNRAQRRAAKHKTATLRAPGRWQKDPDAVTHLLHIAAHHGPERLVSEHLQCRASFERLRDGGAQEWDFDLVSHVLNAAMVRAEQIDELLVETIQRGQNAMARAQDRYRRGLRLGFDAAGLRDVPAALDAWEAIADISTPLQRRNAIKEAWRRIGAGHTIKAA